jgi:FKBP-type peptidyl-prolyl cis-trans isomerase FkpA
MSLNTLKTIFMVSVLLVAGCRSVERKKSLPTPAEMEEMNKLAVKKEGIQIQQFVDKMGWPTIKTGSGLHYYVYEHGTGDSVKPETEVTLRMIITLLNGDTCYTWQRYGDEKFVVERSDNEIGLHEALQYMRKGDKAKIVLPSYLAFGVAGDLDKIPPRSSVVYDIQVLDK